MIVKENEVHRYRCCSNPIKMCVGKNCMGWMIHFILEDKITDPRLKAKLIATDSGYCGIIKG